MDIFAIFQVGSSIKIGRVRGAHNLSHDSIVAGPFATLSAAEKALTNLKAEPQHA